MKAKTKNTLFIWGFVLASLTVFLLPTWLYLLARWVFEPGGFFAEVILAGVALYFGGALQLALLVAWLLVISVMINEFN